jgi:hypothetical protein
MRHPKRFCVRCDSLEALTVRKHRKYSMYHCRRCGEAICRLGDGTQAHALLRVREGIDARSLSEDMLDSMPLTDLACANPDVLSDDHRLWLPEEEAGDGEAWERKVTVALALLTSRQRLVLGAMQRHSGQQKKAAAFLGITQQAVSRTLRQIRKKLQEDGCISDKEGLKGRKTS